MTTHQAWLRPLGMGDLFDRAIRLYRKNFFRFIGVIALMQIPMSGISLIVTLATTDSSPVPLPAPDDPALLENPFSILGPQDYVNLLANLVVGLAYLVLVSGIASAALTRMVAASYLGETPGITAAYRAVGDRWGPLVRTIFLYIALTLLLVAWMVIPCAGWLTGPGMLLVTAGMVLPLVAPVVVLERSGARGSLRRAWELVRSRFWWIFGFMLLLFLFNLVVVSGPSLLGVLALDLVIPDTLAETNPELLSGIQLTADAILNLVFNLLYLPLQLTCLTLLYFDLRVRQEGLDLLLDSGQNQAQSASLRGLIEHTPPAPAAGAFGGREMLNFFLLTLLVIGLYLGLVLVLAGVMMSQGLV